MMVVSSYIYYLDISMEISRYSLDISMEISRVDYSRIWAYTFGPNILGHLTPKYYSRCWAK